jgi:hypothetical protein
MRVRAAGDRREQDRSHEPLPHDQTPHKQGCLSGGVIAVSTTRRVIPAIFPRVARILDAHDPEKGNAGNACYYARRGDIAAARIAT